MFAHVLFYFSTFSFIQTAETVHSCVSLFKAPQTLQQLDRPKETQNISVIEHNTLKTTSEKLLLSLYPSTCYQNIEKLMSDCMNVLSPFETLGQMLMVFYTDMNYESQIQNTGTE